MSESGKILSHQGRLIPANSDQLPAHPVVVNKLESYKARFPQIYEVVGSTAERINRKYNSESDLGDLFADILKAKMGAEIGLISPGATRRDLPKGEVRRLDLLDAFPFTEVTY